MKIAKRVIICKYCETPFAAKPSVFRLSYRCQECKKNNPAPGMGITVVLSTIAVSVAISAIYPKHEWSLLAAALWLCAIIVIQQIFQFLILLWRYPKASEYKVAAEEEKSNTANHEG